MRSGEDRAEEAAFRAFRRKLATGAEELVPAAVADRILDGESRIRVWREHRGLALATLAEAAGIASEMLAAIEDGRGEAGLAVLRDLAAKLDPTLDELAG